MNKVSKIFFRLSTVILLSWFGSCKKTWLEAKPDKSLVIPTSIKDYQSLLDNNLGNYSPFNTTDAINEIGAGDFFVTDQNYAASNPEERNLYKWAPVIYEGDESGDWSTPYSCIFYTNVILEGLEKISPSNLSDQKDWNQVKGSALFFRAFHHFDIAKIFCKPYDKSTASSDLGIPLRIQSDFNVPSVRSSVQATYNQILNDLKQAAQILPIATPINTIYKFRPTKAAANAMLARVYLSMSEYDSALTYANKTLQLYSALINYNQSPPMLTSGIYRIPRFNDETIFYSKFRTYLMLGISRKLIAPGFYQSYNVNDRRRDRFFFPFQGNYVFVGSYDNSAELFGGLATDEIFLISAECKARKGDKNGALADLNTLMQERWSNNGSWVPFTATTADDALSKILAERRKELVFRGVRWTDLRRLNKEQQFATTLTRTVAGNQYTLLPNSALYVLPIPPNVIALTNMEQNVRQ